MKILLTGASGFTGLFFKTQAQKNGHTVMPLVADLTDKAAVTAEVLNAQPEAVVHLAAISFVGHADEAAFYSVNVVGSSNLLSALMTLPIKPKCVLLASSANIYGNCNTSPIFESQQPAPVNHYAISKLSMELMAATYFHSLPIVISRPFNYTGPGQSANFLIPKLVSHFARKADFIELGNLHVEREFNDVRIVCDAYLHLLQRGVSGQTYNICTGVPHTLAHVIETLQSMTGHSITVKVNPSFIRPNEVRRLCGSPAKLQACIGSLPEITLAQTLQWMLNEAV
jgi:nucleoside-diphosphate-sugar epimerase